MHPSIGLALGYLLLPDGADADVLTDEAAETFAGHARRHGYVVASMFTDTTPRTDQGLYALLGALRVGRASAVVVARLDHLTHHPCLAGADEHTITRYLRARILRLDADDHRPRARHRDALQTKPLPLATTRPPARGRPDPRVDLAMAARTLSTPPSERCAARHRQPIVIDSTYSLIPGAITLISPIERSS